MDKLPTIERYGPVGEFVGIYPAKNGRALLVLKDRVGKSVVFSVPERFLKLESPKIGTVVRPLEGDSYHPNGQYCTGVVELSHRKDDLWAAIKEHDDWAARKQAKREAEKQRERGAKKDLGQGKGR